MKNYFIACFLLIYTNVVAQEEFLNAFRANIAPVEFYFQNVLRDNSYIIYCSKNKLLLYIQDQTNVYEITFESTDEEEYKLKKIMFLDNNQVNNIFNQSKFQKGYSDALLIDKTEGLISLNGLPTYFVYKENINKVYAEYILTMIMKPVPMDYDLYKFFTSRMIDSEIN